MTGFMPVKVGMAAALAEGHEGEPAGQFLSAASVPLSACFDRFKTQARDDRRPITLQQIAR